MSLASEWMLSAKARFESSLLMLLAPVSAQPAPLHEGIHYALCGGGKRIRALLTLAAGQLFHAPEAALMRIAAAVEMVHAYSLVHDDMPEMDNDTFRRGKPTVHVRFGQAQALLVGDALQALAFEVLSDTELPAQQVLGMVALLARAVGSQGMCAGQAIDLGHVGVALTLPELEQMHRLKTGALLRAAVFLGAMAGKILSTDEERALETYASALGLAFQVQDDVLDAVGDSATLGKTVGKDAKDHKPTYISLIGLKAAQDLAQQLSEEALCALDYFSVERTEFLRALAALIVQRED